MPSSPSPVDRLVSLGEEVLGKAAQGAVQLKEHVDELTRRVRGLEAMEKRLADVEARLAKLEKPPRKKPAPKTEETT